METTEGMSLYQNIVRPKIIFLFHREVIISCFFKSAGSRIKKIIKSCWLEHQLGNLKVMSSNSVVGWPFFSSLPPNAGPSMISKYTKMESYLRRS